MSVVHLCIDFGGTDIKLGLLDAGTPLTTAVLPVLGTPSDLERAAQAADALIAGEGNAPSAVGIAVPGVVERHTGRMLHANAKYDFLATSGLDIRDWASSRFGVPAVVENDARAALAGEMACGVAGGERDVVMITLGTGIGTAAAMGGRLLRGSHDHAGIVGGHVTVDVHAGPCPCGNVGCAELLASTRALRESHPDIDGIDALIASSRTDAASAALLAGYIRVWGATVVTLCHMYDPDLVVLSGGVLRAGAVVAEPVREYVHAHLWASAHRPRFAVPTAPELSVLRGLSALAQHAHHDIPRTPEEAPR
ncbi:ROK family protein [Microbacterium jiangjiandongii]|uniref:ROK family protein n=1 Tax=Microbacterium jiangjiandongii TaxID=3049071 RepID=UPI00214C177A|nr:ROK family protein [Microbacterium sp. zg.Y843]MCR2815776.1 ROK family protein [Microbacterium sp. zg.Y843]